MRCADLLGRRIHQVEFARVLQDLGYARIAPHGRYGLAYSHVEWLFWIGVDGVVGQIVAQFGVAWILTRNVELSHGANKGFGAVDDVLVDGQAVHGKLLLRVAVLVYNLHLLDNSRLAALSGTCGSGLAGLKQGGAAWPLTQQQNLAFSP
jgi:hypothetical protein